MRINRVTFAMLATLAAILLAPTNASAFAVTSETGDPNHPNELFVGVSDQFVRFTVSGAATNITAFAVSIEPDSNFPGYLDANASVTNVGTTQGGAIDFFFVVDALDPPVFAALLSVDVVDPGADPVVDVPFDILDGDIFVISFTALTPNAPGVSEVTFGICAFVDNECANPSSIIVPITFIERNGNNVPEPATLWLAAAALIAGGLMFRKDSKSS